MSSLGLRGDARAAKAAQTVSRLREMGLSTREIFENYQGMSQEMGAEDAGGSKDFERSTM